VQIGKPLIMASSMLSIVNGDCLLSTSKDARLAFGGSIEHNSDKLVLQTKESKDLFFHSPANETYGISCSHNLGKRQDQRWINYVRVK
jgi:hypothetical protein